MSWRLSNDSSTSYTPLLFWACLIHAALQSVPTLEKSMAVVRHRAHSLPTIYKECAVNREAFSIIRKAGRRVFGQVHPLLCDEVDQTFKTNKLTKLGRWESYTIEWFNKRTARLLVLLGIQAQTARLHLAPLDTTCVHFCPLVSTFVHLCSLGFN